MFIAGPPLVGRIGLTSFLLVSGRFSSRIQTYLTDCRVFSFLDGLCLGLLGYRRFDGLFGELSLVSGRPRALTPVFRRVSNPESVDDVFSDLLGVRGVLIRP